MFTGRWMFCGMVALMTGTAWTDSAFCQPISTQAPALYQEQLAKMVTPLETVLKNLPPAPADAQDGWILLDEDLHLMRPDGSRLRVNHSISKAFTDAGAESIGRSTHDFRTGTTKAHLILARTILPDGTRKPVNPQACFLQTPQRDADSDLYADNEEMVVVFPNVRAGSIVESIVVYEDSRLRIPGQYTAVFGFEGWWPMLESRCVLELPEPYAQRLRMTPLGQGVPEPVKMATAEGQRWTWTRKNIPGSYSESYGAPFMQTGPLVHLTTLKDWGELLHWYVPLAEKSSKLSAKFAAEVDFLTKSAQTQREILDILHRAVANEVRYVGMEFGDCDLEPHPVSEVWEHRYGDCKDKASLLCAMLRHKGIKANMALVNTNYLGRVERRSPDYRHFNHAIAVAELAEGTIFCDPTIEGSVPGMMAPADADREVLLVAEPEQWLRTPAQAGGLYALNFDAAVAPNGEISGWATLAADGYIGTLYRSWEDKSTAPQIKERLTKRIAECYAGARVIDVKTLPPSKDTSYQLRVYFVIPAGGSLTLGFPFDADFLPDFDSEDRKRLTDAFLRREKMESHSTFKLPAGFRAASLPPAFSAKNDHCSGRASWRQEKGMLTADFHFETKSSRLPAADCDAFKQVLASLRSWLDKPITLELGEETAPATETDELASFIPMPSGTGQMTLVNQLFPTGGNLKLRRAALEKTLLWFPKDAATQLSAHTQIAYVDTSEGKHDAGIQRLRTHLQALRGKVTSEQAALADYILAVCLKNKGSKDEALIIVEAIAGNDQISSFRRGWAQYQRSVLLTDKEPKHAIDAALAGIALEDADVASLFQQLAQVRLQAGQSTEFRDDLTGYLTKETPQAAELMIDLAATAERWTSEKPGLAPLLVAVLEQTGDAKRYGKEFGDSLVRARQQSGTYATLAGVRQRLKNWLAAHPKDAPQNSIPTKLKTPEDFDAALNNLLEKNEKEASELVHLAVESLLRFEPAGWYGDRLWRAASYADFLDRTDQIKTPPPILIELLDLCDLTPPLSTPHTEGRFLRALLLTRNEKLNDAASVLHGLLITPDLDRGYFASAVERHAENCLARGDADGALKTWRKLEGLLSFHSTPTELLRACLTALEAGRREDALWFLKLLRQCEKSVIIKSDAADHVTSFLAFAKDDATATAWWEASAKWWPAWLEFEKQHDTPPSILMAPVIPSLTDLGQNLGTFGRAGQKAEAFGLVRTLAHAARWQPSMAIELAELSKSLSTLGLEKWAAGYRAMVIAMYDAGPVPDTALQQRLLIWATASMIDSNQSKRAVEILKDLCKDKALNEANRGTFLRLWAVAATVTGQHLSDVAAAMVQHLAKQASYADRHRDVSSLASIYQKQGKLKEEQELLEKELAAPDNLGKDAVLEPLQQRLEVLLDGAGAGDGPTLAAKAWLAVQRPLWLDFVRPRDLKDEKIANADDAINGGGGLLVAEAVKLCLLTAQTPDQPDERRFNAILSLAWNTAAIATTVAEAAAWIHALKNEKSLPRRMRAEILSAFLRNAFNSDQRNAMRLFVDDPLLTALNPERAGFLTAVRPYAKLEASDLKGAFKLASNLMDEPLDYFSADVVQRCITRLAAGGEFEQARKIYQALGKARFVEQLARSRSARQLAALKNINAAQKLQPLHEALRALFVKSYPGAAKGNAVKEPFHRAFLNLADEDALALYARDIEHGEWEHTDLSFWRELTGILPSNETAAAFGLGALSLIIEKAPDDATRAAFVQHAAALVDVDNADARRRLETSLQPARALADAPMTQDALRLHDLVVKLRTDAPVDMFAVMSSIRDENMQNHARWRIMKVCLARQDIAGLNRLLEGVDTEEILSPANVASSVQAYRLLKKADEAALAMDRVKELAYEGVVTAWTHPRGAYALLSQSHAFELSDAALIPEDFAHSLGAAIQDPRMKLLFLGRQAYLHKRWAECAKHSGEGARLYPNHYDFFSLLGIAQAELGNKEEAVRNLKIFVIYDHNTPEASLAQEYLKKLAK